ncbi:MAG: hypothetical protein A3G38_00335 [Omnitrophica WOR_2 bacterium RIFCSPLOWO2_12_FULL_51_8]|nr:MAG: hypothetical protein A3G38_00335 [Omnitrophica WOR_2 bacterium RIFCSPLOWO2_12_FULL_51_8]
MLKKGFVVLMLSFFPLAYAADLKENCREKIIYEIMPAGRAEFLDFGAVESGGRTLALVTFRTEVLGFDDLEKIYYDHRTDLPLRVERDISWFGKENLVEEYFPERSLLITRKFKGGKKVKEYVFQEDGPIHNAILLPFSLRKAPDLAPGWTMDIRLPDKFKVTLVSLEEVEVPAGKFLAYHFTSAPPKFEIWIANDGPRAPVKIKGLGGLGYTMVMRERICRE